MEFTSLVWLSMITCGFNTTVVSVEYRTCKSTGRCKRVSIQLLFRWNMQKIIANDLGSLFQYNCCFGGILLSVLWFNFSFKFQYNCCFGGIKANEKDLQRAFLFQYNCCFGGMDNRQDLHSSFSTFQYNCCFGGICNKTYYLFLLIRFNTTVVSVESSGVLYNATPATSFNTTVVSVEFWIVSLVTKEIKVSIQLLFRWNQILNLKMLNYL